MDEREVTLAHLADCARRAGRTGRIMFSNFLDPAEAGLAQQAAAAERVPVQLFGGYEDAERTVAAFGWTDGEEIQWPIAVMEAAWDGRFASCQHRDILGSLMALGVDRECFGDIVIDEAHSRALLFALERMEDMLKGSWDSAGRAALRVRRLYDIGELPPPQGELRRITVQSPRLDAVLAAALSLSRAEAQQVVRSGRVRVSFVECTAIDRQLQPGDVVSARGLGRFKLIEEQGRTRRDRLGLCIFKYQNK
ncbi:MAG: YlmH/Sll1252 family protein [Candidatus Fimadaptatus sp.]|jgi:RNA-binding protein YlmH